MGARDFYIPQNVQADCGSTHPPVQWIYSLGVRQPGCEADPLPPSNAEVKNECSLLYLSLHAFTAYTVTYLIVIPTRGMLF